MKLCLRFASCFVLLGVTACSAVPAMPQGPQVPSTALKASAEPTTPTGDSVDRAMKKVVAFSHEAEVREALESRPGEERADKTTAIVPRSMSPEERAAREKCRAADEKIMAKTAKLPVEKRFAMVKAHASLPENKPCADLRAQDFARFEARTTDVRARLHMFRLARGIAEAGQTCTRAAVWSKPVCPEHPALDVDKDSAWACVAKHLTAADKESLGVPAYAYSYSVDARLGVFEIVARGCVADGTTTELVMRGRLGEKTGDLVIYRRKPST